MKKLKALYENFPGNVREAVTKCREFATEIIESPKQDSFNWGRLTLEEFGIAGISALFTAIVVGLIRSILENSSRLHIPTGLLHWSIEVSVFWLLFLFVFIVGSVLYIRFLRPTLIKSSEIQTDGRLAWGGVVLVFGLALKLMQELAFFAASTVSAWPVWSVLAELLMLLCWFSLGAGIAFLFSAMSRDAKGKRKKHIRLLGVSVQTVLLAGWASFLLSAMWIYPWLVGSAYQNLEKKYLEARPIQSILETEVYFDSPEFQIEPGPQSPETITMRSFHRGEELLGRRVLKPLFENLGLIPAGLLLEDLPAEESYVEIVNWFLENLAEDAALRATMPEEPSPTAAPEMFEREELALANYLLSSERTIPEFSTDLIFAFSGVLSANRSIETADVASDEGEDEAVGTSEEELSEETPPDDVQPYVESETLAASSEAFATDREEMARWVAGRLAGTTPPVAYPFHPDEESETPVAVTNNAKASPGMLDSLIDTILPWEIMGTPSQPDDIQTVRALMRWRGPDVAQVVNLSSEDDATAIDGEQELRFQSWFRSTVTELISASHSDSSVQRARFLVSLTQGTEQLAMLFLTIWSLFILLARLVVVRRRNRVLAKVADGEPIDPENDGVTNGPENLLHQIVTGRLSAGDFRRRRSNAELLKREERREGIELAERKTRANRWLLTWLTTALPAIGFIGTVRGISSGLENADAIVRAGSSIEQAAAINLVAGQLGVAFTTTLIALVLGLLLTFAERWQNATEVAFLNRLRDFVQQPKEESQ